MYTFSLIIYTVIPIYIPRAKSLLRACVSIFNMRFRMPIINSILVIQVSDLKRAEDQNKMHIRQLDAESANERT